MLAADRWDFARRLAVATLMLARGVADGLAGRRVVARYGDDFNLHLGPLGQRGYSHSRAGRRVFAEIGRVDFIHRLKIIHAGEENGRLHNVLKVQVFRAQDGADIFEDAFGLFRNVVGNDLPGFWIERDLPGAKKHRAAANRLRVGPNRSRRITGRNDFLHPGMLSEARPVTTRHSRRREAERSVP